MTLLHLEIFIHHFSSPSKFPRDTYTAREYRDDLISEGFLKTMDGIYYPTEKGKAWLNKLLVDPISRFKKEDEKENKMNTKEWLAILAHEIYHSKENQRH